MIVGAKAHHNTGAAKTVRGKHWCSQNSIVLKQSVLYNDYATLSCNSDSEIFIYDIQLVYRMWCLQNNEQHNYKAQTIKIYVAKTGVIVMYNPYDWGSYIDVILRI